MSHVAKEMKRLMGKALHSRDMIQDGDHCWLLFRRQGQPFSPVALEESALLGSHTYRINCGHVIPVIGAHSADGWRSFFRSWF